MADQYKLEALRKLRGERVDQRARLVSDARAVREHADAEVERAYQARTAEQLRAAREREAEQERLAEGAALAADLQQGERFRVGAQARVSALLSGEKLAEERARAATEVENQARGELATAKADAEALEQHRERWALEQQKAAELNEEEAVLDRWTAEKHVKRRA